MIQHIIIANKEVFDSWLNGSIIQYYSDQYSEWIDVDWDYGWCHNHWTKFRIKPTTININGTSVPRGITKPPMHDTIVYIPEIDGNIQPLKFSCGSHHQSKKLKAGLLYDNAHDAKRVAEALKGVFSQ